MRTVCGWLLVGSGLLEAVAAAFDSQFIWGVVVRRLVLFLAGSVDPVPAFASPLTLCAVSTAIALPLLSDARSAFHGRLSRWMQALQVQSGGLAHAIRLLSFSKVDRLATLPANSLQPTRNDLRKADANMGEAIQPGEARRFLANIGVVSGVMFGLCLLIAVSLTIKGVTVGMTGALLGVSCLVVQLAVLYLYLVSTNLPEEPPLASQIKGVER